MLDISTSIGPFLDDKLKEKFLKPERMSSVFTFVCLSVDMPQNTPFDLGT